MRNSLQEEKRRIRECFDPKVKEKEEVTNVFSLTGWREQQRSF
jgi:hypothetical protein